MTGLTSSNAPLDAARALLDAHLPARFSVTVDEATTTAGSVTLTVVTPPRPLVFAPLVGADKARMLVQVTICDSTPTGCRLAGDQVRHVLTGTTRRGALLTPIEVEGFTFDPPASLGDGHGDTNQGVHTWVETYELVWADR